MTQTPLVSLVMPVWRPRPEWLRQAVDSGLGQHGAEIELVVVDDGCPDPVAGLLEGITDPRLSIVRVEHGGVSAARNAGTAHARGDWLRYVDADDVLEPSSTARLLAAAAGDEAVVPYGATALCDEQLRRIWTMRGRVSGDGTVPALLSRWPVRLPSVLISRRAAAAAGPWDETLAICEDWDFLLRVAEHGRLRPDRPIATYYRRHGQSATADTAAGLQATHRVVGGYFERHPEQRGSSLQRRADATLAAIAARVHASHGEPAAATRAAIQALRTDPSALISQVAQSSPAVWGHLRYRLRPSRPQAPAER